MPVAAEEVLPLRNGTAILNPYPEGAMRGNRDWERWIELIRRRELPIDFLCETGKATFWQILAPGGEPRKGWTPKDANSLLPNVYTKVIERGPSFRHDGQDDPSVALWRWLCGIVEEVVCEAARGD